MPQLNPAFETFAKIKVVGVGGSGGKAISRMIAQKIHGVEFVAVNTDAQDLHFSNAPTRVHIGKNLTKGLGAGMNPEVGRQAAEENRDEIQQVLKGADMVFVTCGLGGGTGSGAGPVVAEAARSAGALTIGVVTRPFGFEGAQRSRIAEESWQLFRDQVDALITIPNDRLLGMIDRKTPLLAAFAMVDDVLRHGVQGISDLITFPGLINVDFADVKAVMRDAGSALMGIGRASGDDRAVAAARQAINSPLLEVAIDGAQGVLFSIAGGEDLSLAEVNDAARAITENIDSEAKVIFGSVIDEKLKKGEVKVTVIATGFGSTPRPRRKSPTEAPKTIVSINDLEDAEPVRPASRAAVRASDAATNSARTETPSHAAKAQQAAARQEVREEVAQPQRPEAPRAPQSHSFFEEIIRVGGSEEDDEFEIPAFIRKKMK